MEKENITAEGNNVTPIAMNKSSSTESPNRRKSGSPLSLIRNFASLSNRGSPQRWSSSKGSPLLKLFGKVGIQKIVFIKSIKLHPFIT